MGNDSELDGFGIRIGAGDKLVSKWATKSDSDASTGKSPLNPPQLSSHTPNKAPRHRSGSRSGSKSQPKPDAFSKLSDLKPPTGLDSMWAHSQPVTWQGNQSGTHSRSSETSKGPESHNSSHRRRRNSHHKRGEENPRLQEPNPLAARIPPRDIGNSSWESTYKESLHNEKPRRGSSNRRSSHGESSRRDGARREFQTEGLSGSKWNTSNKESSNRGFNKDQPRSPIREPFGREAFGRNPPKKEFFNGGTSTRGSFSNRRASNGASSDKGSFNREAANRSLHNKGNPHKESHKPPRDWSRELSGTKVTEPDPTHTAPSKLLSWESILSNQGTSSWAEEEEDFVPTSRSWH